MDSEKRFDQNCYFEDYMLSQRRKKMHSIERQQDEILSEKHQKKVREFREQEAKQEQKNNRTYDELRREYKKLDSRYRLRREEIERLMNKMNIKDHRLIMPTFYELVENRENIKNIIEEYKAQVEQTEQEIEALKEEYLLEKYREEQEEEIKRVEKAKREVRIGLGIPLEGTTVGSVLPEEKEVDLEGEAKDNNQGSSSLAENPAVNSLNLDNLDAAKNDNDAINLLEKAYSESCNRLMFKEQELKRSSALIKNSCTTVSRIMYQLNKDVDSYLLKKERNYEVDQSNVVECLSKIGMQLEKRLSYVHTTNKTVSDENVLMRCAYNRNYKDIELFTSPKFLGLNTVPLEEDSSSEDKEDELIRQEIRRQGYYSQHNDN